MFFVEAHLFNGRPSAQPHRSLYNTAGCLYVSLCHGIVYDIVVEALKEHKYMCGILKLCLEKKGLSPSQDPMFDVKQYRTTFLYQECTAVNQKIEDRTADQTVTLQQ